LIRRKFKFEERRFTEQTTDNFYNNTFSDDEDEIIAGSTVFNINKEEKKKGSKDLTEMGKLQKSNKRMFFEMLNSEPVEEEY
jgi:hypothetical protein